MPMAVLPGSPTTSISSTCICPLLPAPEGSHRAGKRATDILVLLSPRSNDELLPPSFARVGCCYFDPRLRTRRPRDRADRRHRDARWRAGAELADLLRADRWAAELGDLRFQRPFCARLRCRPRRGESRHAYGLR